MRFPDWEKRLREFIESRRHTSYALGSNDCCLFVADAIHAMTGEDLAADLRGYTDGETAQEIIDSHGGMINLVSTFLGDPQGPLVARRGDVVCVKTAAGEAVGICVGNHGAFVSAERLAFWPLDHCNHSWRID